MPIKKTLKRLKEEGSGPYLVVFRERGKTEPEQSIFYGRLHIVFRGC